MLNAVVLRNLFVSLPSFKLESFWRWFKVDEPVRPNSAEQSATMVASIMDEGDRAPEGYVYRIPDGRLFYVPVGESSRDMEISNVQEVINPHKDITAAGGHANVQPYSKLGEMGAYADPNVLTLLVKTYYTKRAAQYLARFSLA